MSGELAAPVATSSDDLDLISPEETAVMCGCSLDFLRKLWSMGRGPAKVAIDGKRYGIRRVDAMELARARAFGTTSKRVPPLHVAA